MIEATKRMARRLIGAVGLNPTSVAHRVAAVKRKAWQQVDRGADARKLMINIGGSNFFKRHWKIMDYRHPGSRHYDFAGMDYSYDLMSLTPMPLAGNSVSFFYSSNTLEHVLDSHLPYIYGEILRCLKPGGAIRIQVPDFDPLYDAFVCDDRFALMNICGDGAYNRFYAMKTLYGEATARATLRGWPDKEVLLQGPFTDEAIAREFLRDFAGHRVGKVTYDQILADARRMSKEAFADCYTQDATVEWRRAYPQEHTLWFNHDKLIKGLQQQGFSTVYRSKAFESCFEEMRGVGKYWAFDHRRPHSSVFVEAIK